MEASIGQPVMATKFTFRAYEREFGFELLKLWRQSFHDAIGVPNDTGLDAVQDHLAFLQSLDPAAMTVALDPQNSAIAGFMTLIGAEVEQLYVHGDYQHQGLGAQFIARAKQGRDHLILYTFERNKGAQAFYDQQGFIIKARGFAGMAENPWATSQDQLADIRYEWQREAAR